MAHNDHGGHGRDLPPDHASAGDVSTTGHSDREVEHVDTVTGHTATSGHAAHADSHGHGHGAHGDGGHDDDEDDDGHGHGGGHGHGDDAAEVPTLVPTTWRQLIFPALILLLVGILVWGPVTNAFQNRPIPINNSEQHSDTGGEESHSTPGQPTEDHGSEDAATPGTEEEPNRAATETVAPESVAPPPDPAAIATQTAVGAAAREGTVARAPVQLTLGGRDFVVKSGNNLLPDWTPPQDQGIATWIEGTYANHILYLPYAEETAQLFSATRSGEKVKLVMNTGQVFEFEVTRAERVHNGPSDGTRFTVTSAMAQDHAGVTLFLIGDPADDRAVVQAEFNGNIQ
jgi:hypothetical protein